MNLKFRIHGLHTLVLAACLASRGTHASPPSPALIGAWPGWPGGPVYGIHLVGNRAFVALGEGGLHILDPSQPNHPELLGRIPTEGLARAVTVRNSLAAVSVGVRQDSPRLIPGTLILLDVSEPSNPRTLASVPGVENALTTVLTPTHAYVADLGFTNPPSLIIANITSPTEPRNTGRYDAQAVITGLATVDHWLVMSRTPITIPGRPPDPLPGGGLRVLDLADPDRPRPVAELFPGKGLQGLFLHESLALAVDGAALHIIALSNPQEPVLLASLPIPDGPTVVAASGSRAIVGHRTGATVVDLSNPANPRVEGTHPTSRNVHALAMQGDLAALAVGEGGVEWISRADPHHPTRLGTYATTRFTQRVAAVGTRAYLADWVNGLEVIDLTHPSQPAPAGSDPFSIPGANAVDATPTRVCVGRGAELLVYEVLPSGSLQRLGSWSGENAIDDVDIDNHHVGVAAQFEGLAVIDITSPSEPVLRSRLLTGDVVRRVDLRGDRAFLLSTIWNTSQARFQSVDLSNLDQPRTEGGLTFRDYAGDMATQGTLAAVGTGGWQDEQGIRHPGYLHLIDLSAPSAPRIVGSLDVDGMISAISLAGPYALIALGPALKLVDISNPALPRVIASLEKPGRTFSDICRIGGLWLAAEPFEGLHILRMFPSARLEAQRQGNTLRLDWPETAMGLELQRSDRAAGGSWIPIAGSTSVRSAIEPVSGGSVLYRLVPPW